MEFEYAYGKANDGGLITLGKNKVGFSSPSSFYIGNVDPITSIASITVGLSGSDSLLLYVSTDGTNYYKMDVINTSNSSFTTANKYQFFRLANGYATNDDVSISSITINYQCELEDDTDELSDITSNAILSGTVASTYTLNYHNGHNSSQCLKIEHDNSANSADIIIDLGGISIPVEEIGRYNVEFYANSENNANYDASHSYTRFLLYPAMGTTRNKNSKYLQTANFSNGSGWTKYTYNLGSISDLKEGEVYTSIYLREFYVNGFVLLDQFRIYLNDSYPAFDSETFNTYEADDISNNQLLYGYGTVTSGVSTSVSSTNSVQSNIVTIDSDWRMWHYAGSHADEDATGLVISFDIAFADIVSGRTRANFTYQYVYNDNGELYKYITPEIGGLTSGTTTKGVTVTDLDNGFRRVVIDFDANRAASEDSETTTTNYGFNVGYARTIYVDNFFIL